MSPDDSLGPDVLDQETYTKARDLYLKDPSRGYNNVVREMGWSNVFAARVINEGVAGFPPIKPVSQESKPAASPGVIASKKRGGLAKPSDRMTNKSYKEGRSVIVQAFDGNVAEPGNALVSTEHLTPTEELNAALETVQRDLAKALPRESQLVRSYREQAIGLSAAASACVRAAQATIAIVTQRIMDDAAKGLIGGEAVAIARVSKLIKLVKLCGDQGERAFKLQRLITGLPMQISATETTETTVDMGDLARITESLERLQAGKNGITMRKNDPCVRKIINVASAVSNPHDAADDNVVSDLTDDDE